MARSKRVGKASPKRPSRVRKQRRKRAKRGARASYHHPELAGLTLAAVGVFLAAVLWLGFSGGPVEHLVRSGVAPPPTSRRSCSSRSAR
jgi:hypothetical protein